jgi:uncharacterized protein
VKRTTAFWDSSALISLCVQEQTSGRARTLAKQYSPVVWWATPVEIQSAISRLHRAGDLKDVGRQAALNRLGLLSQGWREVLPSDRLRALAQDLLTQHPLRAADSLQLAAALVWCQQKPKQRCFLSGEDRLCVAAGDCGFAVARL